MLANDSDADGDPITARLLSMPSHGTLLLNTDGAFLYTPVTGYYGSDSFTYVAADTISESLPITVSLTIFHVNQAPVGTADVYFGTEDQQLSVSAPGVLSNDTDSDGDPLSVRLTQAPVRGSLTLNPDGSLLYTPAPDDFGTLSFSYVINDGFIDSTPVSVTINLAAINDAPVPQADRYTTAEDTVMNATTFATSLLANDFDPDGDALTVQSVLDPLHGALILSANGQFTYTPSPNYFGEDTFSYSVSDGLLTSSPVVVTIAVTPVNDPPTTTADSFTLNEDTSLSIALPGLLANDSDPEGSPITAIRVAGPAREHSS
ncbi:MAG UNVERIFIED_CONTAM: Ig-like domain-containing protein [Planctomycetaceae bacterium]